MKFYRPTSLLSRNNNKTVKGEKYGWITYIMYFAPFTQNSLGKNVCSHASKGCSDACLFLSGFGGMCPTVKKGRINKTNYFLLEREMFLMQLFLEISFLEKKHNSLKEKLCIRLNGTSDIPWEKLKIKENKSIIELFPNIQFYDYTKNNLRFNKILPSNYHLTFSRSEINDNEVDEVLKLGNNVAIVFDELPKIYKGYKVINGDLSDLRFNDEKNVIVGLKYKKSTKSGSDNSQAFNSGFALRLKELIELKENIAA